MLPEKTRGCCNLLSRIHAAEVCDATTADSSNAADRQNKKSCLKTTALKIISRNTPDSRLYCCHINYKPIPHIAFQHSFIGFIYFIHADKFNFGNDVMLGTKIKHLLCLWKTADK